MGEKLGALGGKLPPCPPPLWIEPWYYYDNNITVTIIKIFLQIPKDWVLLTIIVAVVTVDLLIILVGTAIPSSRLNATSVRDAQHPTGTDVSYKLSAYNVYHLAVHYHGYDF